MDRADSICFVLTNGPINPIQSKKNLMSRMENVSNWGKIKYSKWQGKGQLHRFFCQKILHPTTTQTINLHDIFGLVEKNVVCLSTTWPFWRERWGGTQNCQLCWKCSDPGAGSLEGHHTNRSTRIGLAPGKQWNRGPFVILWWLWWPVKRILWHLVFHLKKVSNCQWICDKPFWD